MEDILQIYEKTYEHMGIECFSLSICLPCGFAINGKRHPIDKYYISKQNKLLKYAEKNFLPYAEQDTKAAAAGTAVFRPWLMKGSCTVTYSDDRYVSFFREITVFRGRAMYAYTCESETWDLTSNRLCPLNTFIPEKKTIKTYIDKYARRNTKLKKHLIKSFDRGNFYLTPNGAVIFFPDKRLHITISGEKSIADN